jgi:hypothetical protein
LYSKRELGKVITERIWGEVEGPEMEAECRGKSNRIENVSKTHPLRVYGAVMWNSIYKRTSTDGNGN